MRPSSTRKPGRPRIRTGLLALALATASTVVAVAAGTTVATPVGASPFAANNPTDVPINDSPGTGQNGFTASTVSIPANECQDVVNDVNVEVQWDHQFNGDVSFVLEGPTGDAIILITRRGGGANGGAVLFDDEAGRAAAAVAPGQRPGSWLRPEDPLTVFNSKNPSGTWTLFVVDSDPGSTGTLHDWTLTFNCFDQSDDFGIYSTAVAAIPDNGVGTSQVAVTGCTGPVTDVNVEVVFQHGDSADLRFELVHAGTNAILWDPPASVDRGGWIVFDDESPVPATSATGSGADAFSPWPLGSDGKPHRPDDPLSIFDGKDGNNQWQLLVRDGVRGDVGEIQQFGLEIACGATGGGGGGTVGSACTSARPANFSDVTADNVHLKNIDCILSYGVTQGCGPFDKDGKRPYCPRNPVTRAQIATFTARIIKVAQAPLNSNPPDRFIDDSGPPHEISINQMADVSVINNNGESGNRYDPSAPMRRDHMASFLFNAYRHITGKPMAAGPDAFTDDRGNPHEAAINALAARGVVKGTGGTSYDPAGSVTRASMGSFIARFLQVLEDDGVNLKAL